MLIDHRYDFFLRILAVLRVEISGRKRKIVLQLLLSDSGFLHDLSLYVRKMSVSRRMRHSQKFRRLFVQFLCFIAETGNKLLRMPIRPVRLSHAVVILLQIIVFLRVPSCGGFQFLFHLTVAETVHIDLVFFRKLPLSRVIQIGCQLRKRFFRRVEVIIRFYREKIIEFSSICVICFAHVASCFFPRIINLRIQFVNLLLNIRRRRFTQSNVPVVCFLAVKLFVYAGHVTFVIQKIVRALTDILEAAQYRVINVLTVSLYEHILVLGNVPHENVGFIFDFLRALDALNHLIAGLPLVSAEFLHLSVIFIQQILTGFQIVLRFLLVVFSVNGFICIRVHSGRRIFLNLVIIIFDFGVCIETCRSRGGIPLRSVRFPVIQTYILNSHSVLLSRFKQICFYCIIFVSRVGLPLPFPAN